MSELAEALRAIVCAVAGEYVSRLHPTATTAGFCGSWVGLNPGGRWVWYDINAYPDWIPHIGETPP